MDAMDEIYKIRYDGGSYIGRTPICEQATKIARGYAESTGLSVLVACCWPGWKQPHENVYHPDGSVTHLWDGER